MAGSLGNVVRSQPEICWGDHWRASFAATARRKAGRVAKQHALGRRVRAQVHVARAPHGLDVTVLGAGQDDLLDVVTTLHSGPHQAVAGVHPLHRPL